MLPSSVGEALGLAQPHQVDSQSFRHAYENSDLPEPSRSFN